MDWEVRVSAEARAGIYKIERGVAAIITDGIEALSKMDDPTKDAEEVEPAKDKQTELPTYTIEIHAHFITFSLEQNDGRKIIVISEVI